MTDKKRCRKLTRDEKKVVWSGETQENAGAGWRSSGTLRQTRYPEYEPINPKPVDEEFK